ncbi:nucleolar protein 4 isoform X2 [Neocloeon triangulifer]|uniref:nucleolar protein 4 isoform X2 n=1 Tax=Neocloeon triangulifer TaxID=2078957 RepID=UPI00286F63A1|nr:nucleolar protein 4 isoform X2 [Neocloeon triangulifer]
MAQSVVRPIMRDMFDAFQPWVLGTYGDSAKTKTITARKYARILRTLQGHEANSADNSKFRFWVKAKGFRVGPPPGQPPPKQPRFNPVSRMTRLAEPELYVPTGTEKDQYKKVAVVENFFDIIYSVHVDMEGRAGKHAGQKRTYRAITETYAFLPREAVTKFLLQCTDCQRRPSMTDSGSPSPPPIIPVAPAPGATPSGPAGGSAGGAPVTAHPSVTSATPGRLEPPLIDYSLPITTTYLKHMRSLGLTDDEALNLEKESSMSHPAAKRRAKENLGTPEPESMEDDYQGRNGDLRLDEAEEEGWPPYLKSKLREESPQETASMADETSSSGNKEDEDDEEEDDKLDGPSQDPERLKAFNMFVRLFVDENLDRMVPISKQPKEKIQAIIDSCTRQFPEFGERARKRIRTYLKSCRRTKRSRDQNGASLETARPTPAHLTSVQAEQILAQACENESHNAKRMRLGLEPVSQPMPVSANERPAPIDHFAKAETSTTDSKDAATSKSSFRPSGAPPTFQRPPFQPYSLMSTNGPTDLSMKSSKPLLNHKLNQAEMAAVRQLITGYRESAAFLLRSADELEQLLMQQQP